MAFTITGDHLKLTAGSTTPLIPLVTGWMDKTHPPDKTDPSPQYDHFLGQTYHETTRFKALREIGNDMNFAHYENRRDHKG